MHTACEGAICPSGSQCEVNQTARQAYCQPSCDLDNGGCSDDQICSLCRLNILYLRTIRNILLVTIIRHSRDCMYLFRES